MNLTISLREAQGVTVLDLAGKVVLGEECNSLREQVKQLLAAGKKKLLVNMSGVTRVDSSGIGILVEAVILAAKDDAPFKLVNLDRIVYNTLRTHRLLPAFEVYDSEADALASFQ
ncbi:MAG: STAS domain-containing protein [Acidobacteria bacterium]|nr:STAS domain-containing protein [Acidobacteriota bacterium]